MTKKIAYNEALESTLRSAEESTKIPAPHLTRASLEQSLAEINKALLGPLSNVERIWLCGDRREIRERIAALPIEVS